MSGYVSRDGHWHLTIISLDGRELIRVEHDTPMLPDKTVPVHCDSTRRCGPNRTANGFWVADVAGVAEAARYVDLSTLEAVK